MVKRILEHSMERSGHYYLLCLSTKRPSLFVRLRRVRQVGSAVKQGKVGKSSRARVQVHPTQCIHVSASTSL